MKRYILLTPGPTAIPESVLATFSLPMIHHRTPAFQGIFEQVKADLDEPVVLGPVVHVEALDALAVEETDEDAYGLAPPPRPSAGGAITDPRPSRSRKKSNSPSLSSSLAIL